MTPVAWGVLSTAAINRRLLSAARESSLARFVAVGSRSHEKAAAYAQENALEHAFGSYEELLDTSAVDAVYISLPNGLHLEWTVKALDAGKHVLCEKPLGRDPARVANAFAVAERNGLVLAEAFMYRFHPQTRLIESLVENEAIGELVSVVSAHSFKMTDPDNDVRTSAALDGGALMDLGCYCVSAARLVAGDGATVQASASCNAEGVDIDATGVIEHVHGARSAFDISMNTPRRGWMQLVGRSGLLEVSDPWHCQAERLVLRTDAGTRRVEVPRADPYACQLEAVSRAIRADSELRFGRADAVAQARTLDALLRSVVARAPVGLAA